MIMMGFVVMSGLMMYFFIICFWLLVSYSFNLVVFCSVGLGSKILVSDSILNLLGSDMVVLGLVGCLMVMLVIDLFLFNMYMFCWCFLVNWVMFFIMFELLVIFMMWLCSVLGLFWVMKIGGFGLFLDLVGWFWGLWVLIFMVFFLGLFFVFFFFLLLFLLLFFLFFLLMNNFFLFFFISDLGFNFGNFICIVY